MPVTKSNFPNQECDSASINFNLGFKSSIYNIRLIKVYRIELLTSTLDDNRVLLYDFLITQHDMCVCVLNSV